MHEWNEMDVSTDDELMFSFLSHKNGAIKLRICKIYISILPSTFSSISSSRNCKMSAQHIPDEVSPVNASLYSVNII